MSDSPFSGSTWGRCGHDSRETFVAMKPKVAIETCLVKFQRRLSYDLRMDLDDLLEQISPDTAIGSLYGPRRRSVTAAAN